MGAYPNRSHRRSGQQPDLGPATRTGGATRAGEEAETRAREQRAHAIEPITMRVPEACRYIGISRSTLYVLIAEGEVEIIKLGCSTLVLTESLRALITRRRDESDNTSTHTGD